MTVLRNHFRHTGLPAGAGLAEGVLFSNPAEVQRLLHYCPIHSPTPLGSLPALAEELGIGELMLKDESGRMGLGSFKALGAAHVIARDAAARADCATAHATREQIAQASHGVVYACASAGNHGLSVAAGARVFGANAVIYLSHAVPEAFAQRLRDAGAQVVRAGDDYEASMAVAAADATKHGWTLISDSSWPGYVDIPLRVMEGYLVIGAEVIKTLRGQPDHIFLQAGVGGFAAAMTVLFRERWGDAPTIVVVEPDAAPALMDSIREGSPVKASGGRSTMGRLDCKEPSHLALAALARGADYFLTLDDPQCDAAVQRLGRHDVATTPSGAAGVAAMEPSAEDRYALGLTHDSRVLAFITEGREEAA